MQCVILTTGGTGGHIFPALAVAEEIRRRHPRAMILFMGGKYGQEADLAAKAGLDFIGLPVRGIMGRGLKGVAAAAGMLGALATARAVIRRMRPEIVVGFGGYAAFAGVLAGRMAGTATAIHEQNFFPGMSNRLLGRIVDRIFLSLPDKQRLFPPAKSVLVGNPVRAGIITLY
jgi:UDP-N-acetylglucosamine--N-acetylmuramyl-(pentapeptide) pyrophosphoryl-undecaprenol N-acetylglucosamine transferase